MNRLIDRSVADTCLRSMQHIPPNLLCYISVCDRIYQKIWGFGFFLQSTKGKEMVAFFVKVLGVLAFAWVAAFLVGKFIPGHIVVAGFTLTYSLIAGIVAGVAGLQVEVK